MSFRRLIVPLILAVLAFAVATALAATNTIETVAGNGTAGASGDDGPATSASISFPTEIVPIAGGGFYIVENGNTRVRKVAADGTITPVAGTSPGFSGDGGPATSAQMSAPGGMAITPDNRLLIADANNNRIRAVSPGGTMSTVAGGGGSFGDGGAATSAQLNFPYDVAAASDGSYLIADLDNHRIRKVGSDNVITTVAGTSGGFSGDGGPAVSAKLFKPAGVALAGGGAFLIADTENNRIRRVAADGAITTVAGTGIPGYTGDGGPATAARLDGPWRVAPASDGSFLIADRDNSVIRRVAADGTITTVAGDGTQGYTGDGGPASAARLNRPVGVAITDDNDFLIADTYNHRVRRIDAGDPAPTPTPPQDPTPSPVVTSNELPPFISEAFLTATRPNYLCDAGRWSNLKSGTGFTYAWYKLVPRSSRLFFLEDPVKVSDSVAYLLPEADKGKRFFCTVTVTATDGQRLSVSTDTKILTGKPGLVLVPAESFGNVQVRGIDLFQTTQPIPTSQTFIFAANFLSTTMCGGGTPTSYSPGAVGGCTAPTLVGGDAQKAVYKGVDVDADTSATAIVYVNTTDAPRLPGTELLLKVKARIAGKLEPLELSQRIKDVRQRDALWVTADERARAGSAYEFNIPATWLDGAVKRGSLSLEATVTVPPENARVQECDQRFLILGTNCGSTDNTFTLTSVPVYDNLASLTVRSLRMNGAAQATTQLRSPESVMKAVTETFPGGNRIVIEPYSAMVDITDEEALVLTDDECKDFTTVRSCRISNVRVAGDTWIAADPANRNGYDVLLAVHNYPTGAGTIEPGWVPASGDLASASATNVPRMFMNDGTSSRPWTAAAHEFGHIMGAPHADRATPDPVVGSSGCGGNANGQFGEAWPPNDFGRLDGFAYGFYSALAGTRRGTGVTQDNPGALASGAALWDMMSYCSPESRAWVSPKNWNRFFGTLQRYNRTGRPTRKSFTASSAATGSGQAFVVGTVGPNGASIARVIPADSGNAPPPADSGSQIQVKTLGAGGQQLAEVGAAVSLTIDAPEAVGTFMAPLPSGAAAVEISTPGGQVLDRIEKTKAPSVSVVSPKAGERVRAGRRLTVRWQSSDPEKQALQARVEYAPDGRAFRTVWQGADKGRAVLRSESLPAGTRARIRVVVNDGFNEAEALSKAFVADGSRPAAAITGPAAGSRVPAGARALLRGHATDDRGEPLRGTALTWFAGKKRLGTGAELKAVLPVGRVQVRLVARDRLGRTSTVTRPVTVDALRLELTQLRLPERVSAKAKSVTVRLATNAPATLIVGGKRISVGPTARSVKLQLPAKPALGALRVNYRVTSRGGSTGTLSGTIQVVRI